MLSRDRCWWWNPNLDFPAGMTDDEKQDFLDNLFALQAGMCNPDADIDALCELNDKVVRHVE